MLEIEKGKTILSFVRSVCFVVFLFWLSVTPNGAIASCFSGPTLAENDAYVSWSYTNNCATAVQILYVRRYKKQDGSQGVEKGVWTASACKSGKTPQWYQGEYEIGTGSIDESRLCTGINVERPDAAGDQSSNNRVSSQGKSDLANNSVSSTLASRLSSQQNKNADAAAVRTQQEQLFASHSDNIRNEYEDRKRSAEADKRAAAAASKAVQQNALRESDRVRSDMDYAQRSLCINVRSESVSRGCGAVCNTIRKVSSSDPNDDSCEKQCLPEQIVGVHCATIDPSMRSDILSRVRNILGSNYDVPER
jgi:hypothetical protein